MQILIAAELIVKYRFFFSYASKDYRNSVGNYFGSPPPNPLDQFFRRISESVVSLTGDNEGQVGFLDKSRLQIGETWGHEICKALQGSGVLVALLSPSYINSKNCGREIQFFHELLDMTPKVRGGIPPRVIPIYWVSEKYCYDKMSNELREYWKRIHYWQQGMPDNYPMKGVRDFYLEHDGESTNRLCDALARRIVELNNQDDFPHLESMPDFNRIKSFFDTQSAMQSNIVGEGPLSTSVVYAVATREQLEEIGSTAANYGDNPGDWIPFEEPPRQISRLTQNALLDAGQQEAGLSVLTMDEKLTSSIKKAREVNSLVLIVLDRASVEVTAIEKGLRSYDQVDGPHLGLVTAGSGAEDSRLADILPSKFLGKRPQHLWTVPPDSVAYERQVRQVIIALRGALQSSSSALEQLPQGSLPGLIQPSD